MCICWCIWMAASHTSVGVYEQLLYMYICWCIWMAVSHVHLLVYMNSCFTRTYVGVHEWLIHTRICWCILVAASMYISWLYEWLVHTHMHICWCMWTAASHIHLLVYMNSCFTCTSVAAFRDHNSITTHLVSSQTLYGTCSITTHPVSHKHLYGWYRITTHQVSSHTLVWMVQYHHTSSIITKSLYEPSSITTAPVTNHCVCCMCILSLPEFKLLNLRTLKCHCPVAITVAMMTLMTYGKWKNCPRVHCRSCFY